MKKGILLSLVLTALLVITGCNNSGEEKTLNCTRNATITDGVKMELNYKATYKGDYVQLVETTEKIISDNAAYLENYKSSVEGLYAPYKKIEHYNYNVEIKDNTLISTTKIDYSKIDTDKLIEIDSANSSLIKDGKIKIDDIKSLYESIGATCK
ncbi:MAG: DUF1307 domain-containing protein [Bacilli bacterium]